MKNSMVKTSQLSIARLLILRFSATKMQNFVRNLHASSARARGVAKFIDASKKIPQLRSTPTIYNTKSSASNPKGFMKAKIPGGLYFQPAQSSATGSINSETYPSSFLPQGDSRKSHIENLRAEDRLKGDYAPPVLVSKSSMGKKTYHLKPSDVAEIQRLRNENPELHTRKALAQRFKVSPLFISIVSTASRQRNEEMASRLEQIKSQWHDKRRSARSDRIKRKQYWYRP